MSILVVGSVALDTITTPHGHAEEIIGGSASHFSVAASFFAPVKLVAVVGEDFPRKHLDLFERHGIDLTGLQVASGRTFRWSGYYTVDYHKAYTLQTQLNVFSGFRPSVPESYRQPGYVFLANIDPDLQMDVLRQIDRPLYVVGDTMNFWIESRRAKVLEMMRQIDCLLVNDGEARDLCETRNLVEAGRRMLSMGPRHVVIKKGEHGALFFHDTAVFSAPAYPYAQVKDPTGAGDSFAGGFLGQIARTGDTSPEGLRRAVAYGCVLGSFNIEDFSLFRLEKATPEEIESRYQEIRRVAEF